MGDFMVYRSSLRKKELDRINKKNVDPQVFINCLKNDEEDFNQYLRLSISNIITISCFGNHGSIDRLQRK